MSKEPKWTMQDLINHFGISQIDFMNLCKKAPLPEPVLVPGRSFQARTRKKRQWYNKSELFAWYKKVTQ